MESKSPALFVAVEISLSLSLKGQDSGLIFIAFPQKGKKHFAQEGQTPWISERVSSWDLARGG